MGARMVADGVLTLEAGALDRSFLKAKGGRATSSIVEL